MSKLFKILILSVVLFGLAHSGPIDETGRMAMENENMENMSRMEMAENKEARMNMPENKVARMAMENENMARMNMPENKEMNARMDMPENRVARMAMENENMARMEMAENKEARMNMPENKMTRMSMENVDMPEGSARMDMSDSKSEMLSPEKRGLVLNIENSSSIASLCESSAEFKYFIPYPSDETKYLQCDPWGTGSLKSCDEGLVWNMWSLKCDLRENIKNLTFNISTSQNAEPINCTLVGVECLNGGMCRESLTGLAGSYRCVCGPDFTGEFCENRVDLTDLSHEILNGTFSIADYKAKLIAANISVETSYYERYQEHLDNVTYSELMKYLSFYNKSEIRYDTLINSLIQDILEDIYPDAEYLSSFNASSQNVVTMVRLIPSLLSYSRYSLDRYEEVFGQYQKVLNGLIEILNGTVATIKDEALQYSRLTGIFLNQTMTILSQKSAESKNLVIESQSVEPTQLNEVEMKSSLRSNFNSTLRSTEKLFESLQQFQNTVIEQLQIDPSLSRLTLGEARFQGAQETLAVFNEIAASSSQIWDSLVNYGFWYLTNILTTPVAKETIDSLNLGLAAKF